MKKNSLKKAFAAIAMSAVAVSATSVSAFAEIPTGADPYTAIGLDAATDGEPTVKPQLAVQRNVIDVNEIPADRLVQVEFSVSGAEGQYAATGLHFYWDERLTIVEDADEESYVIPGAAVKKLSVGEPALDGGVNHGLFIATNAKNTENAGKDGVMYTLTFQLPEDAAAGDYYPVNLVYIYSDSAQDRFTTITNDDEAKKMQAYAFAHVNTDGGIEITGATTTTTEEVTTTETTTTETTTETTTTETTTETTTTTTATTTTAAGVIGGDDGTNTTDSGTVLNEDATGTGSTTADPNAGLTTAATTTTKTTATTKAASNNSSASSSPKTGVAGVGVAAAGLAIAVGTAFVLRKKED